MDAGNGRKDATMSDNPHQERGLADITRFQTK